MTLMANLHNMGLSNFFPIFFGKSFPIFIKRIPQGIVNDSKAGVMGSFIHMACSTGGSPFRVPLGGIDGPMNGGSVHFVVGASHARVALFTSFRFFRFRRVEGMGSMTA